MNIKSSHVNNSKTNHLELTEQTRLNKEGKNKKQKSIKLVMSNLFRKRKNTATLL